MRFSIKKKNKSFRKNYMKVGVKKWLRSGMMPARTWGAHAVGMAPERLKMRRQMAAAAGKRSTTSLSLLMETYGLEVEEELSAMAVQCWAEGAWTRKWSHEQKETWMRQIREVQTWKQVKGPAGAVTCETRDLDIKWPYRQILVFSYEMKIDMRYVCPKDVKKMLVHRARSVYWEKWAAKHQYEELEESSSAKERKGDWTEKHRNAARKIFLEGGWTQKKFIRNWMVGHQSVSSLSDGGRHRKAQALPLSGMARSEARYSGSLHEMGAKGGNIKERMEMA